MSAPDPTSEEVQLLDAEIFETPRRLSRADALEETGGLHDRHPFDQPDPEDDR